MQYVIGKSHFYGLEFDVNNHVLIPRPETEILVDTVLQYLQQQNHRQKIIDIGTGSGCIPITIASKASPEKIETISAIDISAEAISIAKHNAEINNVTINFTQADIFKDSIEKTDDDGTVQIYSYKFCENSSQESLKKFRGVVFSGETSLFSSLGYTEEYNENDREKWIINVKSILPSIKPSIFFNPIFITSY